MTMASPVVAAFAPGRVNLIGEHTDYNEGLALPFATAAGIRVEAKAQPGDSVHAEASDLKEEDQFSIGSVPAADGWRAYVRGAVAELCAAGVRVPGVRLRIGGDLPRGSGLSSSAALEVAVCLALISLAGSEGPTGLDLARLCSRIEHEWVGSRSGLLDQLASLCSRSGAGVKIDFRSLELRHVPLDMADHRLVTLDSGESHVNASSGYNERRSECERACELLGVGSLRDATLASAAELPAPLGGRVRHVVSENGRVEQTVTALSRGDWSSVGRLLDASHASLRDDYEVSTPAVEEAVGRLRDAGALGARIMGGGFGGHVLGLLAPGADLPEGAVEVRPGAGARLL